GLDHPDVATAINNIAANYRLKGEYEKAEPLDQRALEIRMKALGPDHPLVAYSLNNLALIQEARGDYDKAEELYQRSLDIKEKALGQDHPDVAATLNNLATLSRERGDLDKAELLLQNALDIKVRALGPDHPLVASSLNNLAVVCRNKGEFERAEQLHQRALAIRVKALGPDHPEVASSLTNLGALFSVSGNLVKAEQMYKRALDIRLKAFGDQHPLVATLFNNLSEVYRLEGDYARAEPLGKRAVEIREKMLGPEHPLVASGYSNLARLYAAKGDIEQAIASQSRANWITEHNITLNLVNGSERQKLVYLSSLPEVLDTTVSLHIRNAPDNVNALELGASTILHYKGRLLDFMSDSLAALRRRLTPRDQALLDELNGTTAELARLVLNGPERTTPTEHQKRIIALEERRETLESEISRRSQGSYQQEKPITLAEVRAAIPLDSALLEFAVYRAFDPKARGHIGAYSAPRYAVYVIHRQGEVQWKDLGEAKEIDSAIGELRSALRDPSRGDVRKLARELDHKIMKPIRPMLASDSRLLISPDGELSMIPFEALVDEQGEYLMKRYAISYLTSGRDLLRLQVARESASPPLVVADPSFGEPPAQVTTIRKATVKSPSLGRHRQGLGAADFSSVYFAPLAGTKQEARAIKSLFPEARVVTGQEATESSLKSTAAPIILHIATHGFFLTSGPAPPSNPPQSTRAINSTTKIENPLLRSGLALAGANLHTGNADDGILTALEASGLNLWGTKLVTLSACDTGVGEVRNGEGVYGLRRAFVLAGTETLVMSLWPVSDYVTREMMTAYYSGLNQLQGRGEALRQVKLRMLKRKDRQHPFYWASFIQSGEWANLDGKR
ncbi:MAG TPA: CHAT domain-containing tetratricopeptide repeat protein, partial [Blastocatellia bacterium]|nr:CHAT domain-containing tetratricopeptide repeat protein [Blastocatellia bacterium]